MHDRFRLAPRGGAGFTLIEIMVVLVILGILAGVIMPKLLSRPEEARRTKAKIQMRSLMAALDLFKLDNGFYPSTDQGLQALVTKPTVGQIPPNWKEGGYLDKVPPDPWGNPYVYLSPGQQGEYDLISYGADGQPGGDGKNADAQSWNLD